MSSDRFGSPRFLRREAYPFSWEELTTHQQSAVEKIAGFLLRALHGLESSAGARGSVDLDRRSQLTFIDGDRGMGKISVLLSIRNLIENGSPVAANIPPSLPSDVAQLQAERRRFVLLETLDMEPLARNANLLAAILVRISKLVEYPAKPFSPRLALAFDDVEGREKLISELQQLEFDAIHAWGGPERQQYGAYSVDVLAAERAGINLHPRLRSVLDGLATVVYGGASLGPIFVIPIDDFDLAPARCLELLRIVRMVSTPRLFFLLAGNTRIAEKILRLNAEGELALLAGDAMAGLSAKSVQASAIEIAANNIRKLVPPQQRARLEMVSVGEARRTRLSPESPSLDDLLGSILLERNNAATEKSWLSLKSFLFPSENSIYSGAQWLSATSRQLLDRITMFSELQGEHRHDYGEHLLRMLTEDMRRELSEYGHVDPAQRERILDVLDISGSPRFNFRSAFLVEGDVGREGRIKSEYFSLIFRFPGTYRWLTRQGNNQDSKMPLPVRVGASLTFLHDLAISLWGGFVFPNSIIYDARQFVGLVKINWSPGSERCVVPWHLPEWWTLRELERFASHWEAHASNSVSADDHICAWLAAQLEVLLDIPLDLSSPERGLGRLRHLLGQLAHEEPVRFARKYLVDSALVSIALLLAPESGCDVATARALLGSRFILLHRLSDQMKERVRDARARTFATAMQDELSGPPTALLAAVNPELAIDITWKRFRSILQSDEFLRPKSPELLHVVSEVHKRGPASPDLASNIELLIALSGPDREDLLDASSAMFMALKRSFSKHPINEFGQGLLVPRQQEISMKRAKRSQFRP
jgi:hypothetical protein